MRAESTNQSRSLAWRLGASAVAIAVAGVSAPAFAQAAPANEQESAAQEAAQPPLGPPAPSSLDSADREIVVTGSRIARRDFEGNSPIVTVDETFLQQSSTAAIEQQLNRLPQFVVSQSSTVKNNEGILVGAGGDIQPNATNTPGAATISLRGVGANRTLVLIDGRRGTPGNASGAVDISTIPSSALQRSEIITGGASATYGADAVAGVTNLILKRDFVGLELDAQGGISQYGSGSEYQISGILGADFDDGRGNVSLALSTNVRHADYERDRPWFRDLWANGSTTAGQFFFVPRPGVTNLGLPANTGTPGTFPPYCETTPSGCALTNYFAARGANPSVPNNTGNVYFNEDGSLFTTGFPDRGGAAFFRPWTAVDGGSFWKRTDVGTLSYINAGNYLVVPQTRYNFLGRGNYEINDWVGVFGQMLFSDSKTRSKQEPGPLIGGWGVNIPWGTGRYVGNVSVPSSVIRNGELLNGVPYVDPTPATIEDNPTNPAFTNIYRNILPCATGPNGCSNTQAFQSVVPDSLEGLLNSRTNPNAAFGITGFLPTPRETFSDVTTYNIVAGLEGSIPGSDFTWELYVNHGVSTTLSRQTGMYSLERTRALFTAPNMGQNFSDTGNDQGSGFGAVTGRCTTGLNFFGNYQGISPNCAEAIAADVNNKSETRQTIVEANLQGGLFELPAGQVRFALGASYRENRYEFNNETLTTAGRSFLDQVIGIYPSANMNAGIDVKELYGELLIPILADRPFFENLSLEIGGRMSDYNTTGTSYTYKILGDWEVADWLRFRGGYNRAERAPNMSELLLTPQQTFRSDTIGDLCSDRHNSPGSANPATNRGGAGAALDVQAVCMELMARDNNGVFTPTSDAVNSFYGSVWTNFRPTGGGAGFAYAVGNEVFRQTFDPTIPQLKPEVADTWTAGVVIQSPFDGGMLSRLNLSIDYFNIKIKDPIGLLAAGAILQRCVDPAFNSAVTGASAGGLGSAQSRAAAAAALAASQACQAVYRNPSNPAFFLPGGFDTARVTTTYNNEGLVQLSGIDAQLNWSADAGPGTVFVNLNGNYMIDFKVQELEGGPVLDYVGTQGTGAKGLNFGSSFEYRIFGSLGYSLGGATATLQWQHIPATEDSAEVNFLNGVAPSGTDNNGIPAYNLFSLYGSYAVTDNFTFRFGVDNLFNKRPPITGVDLVTNPTTGELPGGSFSLFHDIQGRRFSLGATAKF